MRGLIMRLFKNYLFRFLKTTVLMLLLISPLVIFRMYDPQSFVSLQSTVSEHVMFFRILRWLFIIAFIANWHVWVKLLARKQQWSETRKNFWLSQRWRIGAWLIVFELLICENVLSVFFHSFH
jgi:hypothetical protein